MKPILITLTMILMPFISPVYGKDIEMTCKHSFQGNYNGSDVLLKCEKKFCPKFFGESTSKLSFWYF